MKFFLAFLFFSFSLTVFSQNMLLVERPGTVKNYKYYAGNYISLQTKDGEKISGPINIIRDTNLIVDYTHEIAISDIAIVYKSRTLIALTSGALIAGAGMYTALDLINGGSKGKSFSQNQNLHISLAILATGIGLQFFKKKKMRIEENKWRVKILVP